YRSAGSWCHKVIWWSATTPESWSCHARGSWKFSSRQNGSSPLTSVWKKEFAQEKALVRPPQRPDIFPHKKNGRHDRRTGRASRKMCDLVWCRDHSGEETDDDATGQRRSARHPARRRHLAYLRQSGIDRDAVDGRAGRWARHHLRAG